MNVVLDHPHLAHYERALRVIEGLQVYWAESPLMRDRFTAAETVIMQRFIGVRFRFEPPIYGWWRIPGALEVGSFKPGQVSAYKKLWAASNLKRRDIWIRHERIVDTGEPRADLWSSRPSLNENLSRWSGIRQSATHSAPEAQFVVTNTYRDWLFAKASALSELETVWFPFAEAEALCAVTLHHFTERTVGGKVLSEMEFDEARFQSRLLFDRPGMAVKDALTRGGVGDEPRRKPGDAGT